MTNHPPTTADAWEDPKPTDGRRPVGGRSRRRVEREEHGDEGEGSSTDTMRPTAGAADVY